MAFNPFLCIYLLSCISSDSPLNSPKCPRSFCQCYKAPKDGYGEDSALSLSCNWSATKSTRVDNFKTLESESINTLAIENFNFDPTNTERIPTLSGFSVNNLELKNCDLSLFQSNPNIFLGLNKNNFKVLSFIDTKLNDEYNYFDWTSLGSFNNLKVLTIKGGQLSQLLADFQDIATNQLFCVTIESTGLAYIGDPIFVKFKRLKMLTIAKNSISSLSWLAQIESPLWYLDLRQNQLTSFPEDIAAKLKHLKTLKIGGNKIHVIHSDTAKILLNIVELSFEVEESGKLVLSPDDYLIPTSDMVWIKDVLSRKDEWSQVSLANYYNLEQMKCVKFNRDNLRLCKELGDDDFVCVESEQLAVIEINRKEMFLSYNCRPSFLSGAVLPVDWHKDKLPIYLDKVAKAKGNVIKLSLDTQEWFNLQPSESNTNKFKEFLEVLEKNLQNIEDHDIFVIITLWKANHIVDQLLNENPEVFERYVDYHLKPLVNTLNKFRALAAWNVIDEPERLVRPIYNSEKCKDTHELVNPSPNGNKPIELVQKFVATHANIIHQVSPQKLVTVGISDLNRFTHFEDNCLKTSVTGSNLCVGDSCFLDFYTIIIKSSSELKDYPFKQQEISTESPKPVVIVLDESFDRISALYKYDEGMVQNWQHRGIMATFKEGDDGYYNKEIENGIANLKNNQVVGPRIYGPKRYNYILTK